MAIRKVSDLPQFEVTSDGEVLSNSLLEISKYNNSSEGRTYDSRCVSFGDLQHIIVQKVHTEISDEYNNIASEEEFGRVKLGYINNYEYNNYAISSNDEGRIFVHIPNNELVEKVDNISGIDGNITLNSISAISVDNYYLSSSVDRITRQAKLFFTPRLCPDFNNLEELEKNDLISGVGLSTENSFVYINFGTSAQDQQVSCLMSYIEDDETQWQTFYNFYKPASEVFGTSFCVFKDKKIKVMYSEEGAFTITGYMCTCL